MHNRSNIPLWLLYIAVCGIIFLSCGQQKTFNDNNNGISDLRIQDVSYNRASTVSHDQFGKPAMGSHRRFFFVLNVINTGTADFFGFLSVANTRSNLDQYDHIERTSKEPVRIHVGEVITVTTADEFSDFVKWVRLRLDVKSLANKNSDSLASVVTTYHFKEIALPDK